MANIITIESWDKVFVWLLHDIQIIFKPLISLEHIRWTFSFFFALHFLLYLLSFFVISSVKTLTSGNPYFVPTFSKIQEKVYFMISLFSIPFSPQVSFIISCLTQQIIRPQLGPFLQVLSCQRWNRFYIFEVDYTCFTHRDKYYTFEWRNSSPLLPLSSSCSLSNENKDNSSGENGM